MQSSNKDNLTQKRKNSLKNYYTSLGLTSNNETEKVEEKKETFLPEVTVSEKIDNTLYASLGNLAKGAIGTVEGYIDSAVSAANKIGIISDSATKNFIEKDLTTKYYNKIMPFATFMGGGSVLKYIQEYKKYGRLLTPEEKEQLSYMNTGVGQIAGQVLQGVGQQLPNIGIGKAIGATAGLLGAGTKGVGIATQIGSTTAFTSSAIGNSTAEALYEGADLDEAQTYGVLSGALETGVEFLSGGIGGVGEGLLDKAIPQISKNKAVKYIVGALGEGAEEMVSEVVTPYIKRYTYDKDAETATKEQVFEAGLIGTLCGAVMETGQVLSTPKGIRVAQDIQTELEYMEKHQDNPDLVNKSYERIQELSEKFATEMERVGMDSNVLQAEFYEKQIKQTKEKMEKESVKLKELDTSIYEEDLNRYNQSKDNAIKTMKDNVRGEYLAKTNQYYKYDFNSGEKSKLYESLSQENRAKIDETVEFMNAAQSRTGTNLYLEIDFEGENTNVGENGFIDLENNRIVLNPDNMDTRKAKNNILAHELTHLSENTKSGKKLNNFVLKHLKELGLYEEEYEKTYKLYENYFKDKNAEFNNLTAEEKQNYINKEIVADFVQENLFTSQESINKLANEDTSMAKSVLNWIKSKVESLSKSNKERETQKMLKKAENMYIKALDEVKRNRQNINNDVKYSKSNKINFQVPEQYKKLSKEERYRKSLDFNDMLMRKLREDGTIRDYFFQLDSDIIYQEYASLDEDGNIEQNTPILLEIEKMTKNYGLSETNAHDIQQSILEEIDNAKRRNGKTIRFKDVGQIVDLCIRQQLSREQNISSNTNVRSSETDNRINREISKSNRNTISETIREQGRVDNTKKSLNKEQQNEQTREYNDEFRRLQEESRRELSSSSWSERSERNDETLRRRLSDNFKRRLDSRGYNSSTSNAILLNSNKNTSFRMYENIDGDIFHDIFEIARTYTKNGELVDLHENYNDCTCYLSDDGLSGFAITSTGDLVSVYNMDKNKKGFLSAISPVVKEKAKTLDCYVSPKQNLQAMYTKIFDFQTASIMDHNMEYDHDDIAQNHNMPQVAFMVNTDQQIETKNFNKDQYDEAKAYQESFIKTRDQLLNEIKEFKYTKNIESWKYFDKLDYNELELINKYSKGNDLTFEEIMSMKNVKEAEKYLKEHPQLEVAENLELVQKTKQEFKERLLKEADSRGGAKKERKAFFATGLPGAGKSTTGLSEYLNNGYIEFDNDIAKEAPSLSKYYDNGLGAGVVQDIVSQAQKELWTEFLEEGYNIAYPCIGKKYSKLCEEILQLKDYGYDIEKDFSVGYVSVDLETSMTRATTRFLQTGRYVSTNYIKSVGIQPENAIQQLMKEGVKDERTNTTYKIRVTKYDNRTNNKQSSGIRTSEGLQQVHNTKNQASKGRLQYGGSNRLSNGSNLGRTQTSLDDVDNIKKYSLAKSTIDKVKGQVSTNNETFKEKTSETMLKSQIQFVDAQAGIEDAFKKLGAKASQNISANFARAASARGNEALRSGIFDKEGKVLSKGYDEIFVDTIPQEYMLKENADKRDMYIRERNNYLFHYLNIDRMENVFNKLRTSDMEKVTLSEKGKTLIENAITDSEYKSLNIDEIRDLNLSQEDLTNLEGYLRNIKSVFGEYINFNEISSEDKEYLKRNAPELYEKIKESPISESDFDKITERYELDGQSKEIKSIKKAMREINADESRAALREIEQQYPGFKKQAKDIWDYGKALLEIEYQAGLISKEAKEYLNETYPHYVPTNRDLYGYSSKGARASDNTVNVTQNVKTAKGSDLLLEPIEVMLARRTMRAYKADAINSLALELENAYNISQYEDKDSLIQFSEDIEIPKNVEQIDYEKIGASQDGKYVTYYKDGEMKKMSVSNEIYEGFKDLSGGMRSSSYNTITKGIRKINKIFKSSITSYNPFFVARNVTRDIQDALLYSKNGFGKIVTNLPKAWKQMSNNGEMWQEYLRSGGLQSSLFNFETGTETAKSISNFENKVGKKVRKVGQAIEKVNMYTEQMVRFSEYMLSRENGKSSKQALYDANEVTVNFGRGGTMTKELNATIMPFLNPATQGASKFARTFMSPKSAKEWRNLIGRVALLGIVPALFNAIAYDDDEEYEALGSYYKENYYMIKIGSNKFLRIPKGRVLALFQSTTSRTMSLKDKSFKEAFEGYGDNIETALSPVNNFRTIFSPISDVKTNTTWYGGEIESQKYSKISPKYRYDDETSAIAKLIGQTINYSPLKIDYILDQYTGVFGDIFLSIGTTKGQTSLEDNFVVDTTYKNKYSSEFYSKLEKCEYAKSEGDVVATLKVRYLNKCKNTISDIQDQQLEIEKNTELSKEEKAAQTKVLQILLNNAFKNAIENVEVLGNYLGKNCELSSISIEDDYIEAIRQCFGAEEALRQYNTNAFSKATALQNVANIDYDIFYCVYLDCKEIESDYDSNGKAISGSKKAKIVDYVNNVSNLTKTQRILLLAALGYKPNDANSIVSYLKTQGKTGNEINELLEILNLSLTN